MDATYLKSRIENFITTHAMIIVSAVDEDGQREIIAISPIHTESHEAIFSYLKSRGLSGVKLIISDDNKGLTKGSKKDLFRMFLAKMWFSF